MSAGPHGCVPIRESGAAERVASYVLTDATLQRWLVAVVGAVTLFFGVYGFVVAGAAEPNTFGISNLESPADNVLHFVVGVWALYAAFMGRASMSATA